MDQARLPDAEKLVRDAARRGAQVILLQELFETPYFCQDQSAEHFKLAAPFDGNALIAQMAALAKDIALTIHPHPTLSETIMQSAEVFFGTSTDLYRPKR